MQKAKIEYLRERVNSDKLEDAIKILRTEIPENDDVVSIGGRLNRMNAQTVRGIANSDELNNERNNIRESLILFLNKLSEKNVPPKPHWLKIIFKIGIFKISITLAVIAVVIIVINWDSFFLKKEVSQPNIQQQIPPIIINNQNGNNNNIGGSTPEVKNEAKKPNENHSKSEEENRRHECKDRAIKICDEGEKLRNKTAPSVVQKDYLEWRTTWNRLKDCDPNIMEDLDKIRDSSCLHCYNQIMDIQIKTIKAKFN